MKITHMLAAALMVAGIGVSTEASAQRYAGYNQDVRYDRHDRDNRNDRRWDRRNDRRDRNWSRNDRGRHYGWRNDRGRNHCRIVYRHGQRYTVCR